MKINRQNYEAFFLDFWEQSLDSRQVDELMIFLDHNPDLKSGFYDFEMIRLEPDLQLSFGEKENLKKNSVVQAGKVNGDNYNDYFIAAHEQILNPAEKNDLERFLSLNPSLEKDYRMFGQAYLKPDITLVCPVKENLKRKVIPLYARKYILYPLAVAASVLVFLTIYLNIDRPGTYGTGDLVSITNLLPASPSGEQTVEPVAGPLLRDPVQIAGVNSDAAVTVTRQALPRFENAGLREAVAVNLPEEESFEGYAEWRFAGAELYEALKLREFYKDFFNNPVKEKTFAGTFIRNVAGKLTGRGEGQPDQENRFLNYTIQGYNMIADRNLYLKRQYDKYGNVTAINVTDGTKDYYSISKSSR